MLTLRVVNIVVDRVATADSFFRSACFGWTKKFICSSDQSYLVADAVKLCIGACMFNHKPTQSYIILYKITENEKNSKLCSVRWCKNCKRGFWIPFSFFLTPNMKTLVINGKKLLIVGCLWLAGNQSNSHTSVVITLTVMS